LFDFFWWKLTKFFFDLFWKLRELWKSILSSRCPPIYPFNDILGINCGPPKLRIHNLSYMGIMKLVQITNEYWLSLFKSIDNLKATIQDFFTNFLIQESYIQIVFWNPKLIMINISLGGKVIDIKKLVLVIEYLKCYYRGYYKDCLKTKPINLGVSFGVEPFSILTSKM